LWVLILPEAVQKERLISSEYRREQQDLHRNPDYGVASTHYAPIVARVMNQNGVQELLDYGCGKGRLGDTLFQGQMVDHAFRLQQYDPAMPQWSESPDPAEMVACIDVLEHIEPKLLENVLDDLQRVTREIGVFTVSTEPAIKTLSDGRNAHLIIEGPEFWLPKFMERFELHSFQKVPDGFTVMVAAKQVEQ
jgi:hypothetical protein